MNYIVNNELRNKCIFLLKKYTSYRFLYTAYLLNKDFVDAFENQLRDSKLSNKYITSSLEQAQYESEYVYYLDIMDRKEKGFENIFKSEVKSESYSMICSGGFINKIFGRYGDEKGLINDKFYQNLGLLSSNGFIYDSNQQVRFIKKILDSGKFWDLAGITLFDGEYNIPEKYNRDYIKWTYESMFSEDYWPLFKQVNDFMEFLPDYNVDSSKQIKSGNEIQLSGIYEPWFEQPMYEKSTNDPEYNTYVGCPNYFLDNAIATQYKLEGTDNYYDVNWRLIWEDTRYLDGYVSDEEKNYILDHQGMSSTHTLSKNRLGQKISLQAGQLCTQKGYWYSTAKDNTRRLFKKGEVMPSIESDWGQVHWYYDGVD